jgi:hypothetical protein
MSQQIQNLGERANGDLRCSVASEKSSRISQKAVVAEIDGISAQKALRGDEGVVSVNEHRPAAESMQPQSFGHSA